MMAHIPSALMLADQPYEELAAATSPEGLKKKTELKKEEKQEEQPSSTGEPGDELLEKDSESNPEQESASKEGPDEAPENSADIDDWRREQSLKRTWERHPALLLNDSLQLSVRKQLQTKVVKDLLSS